MSEIDIIRAWKDPEYRNSLTEEQRKQLPENPAGMIEMSDEETEKIEGGKSTTSIFCKYSYSLGCNFTKKASCWTMSYACWK